MKRSFILMFYLLFINHSMVVAKEWDKHSLIIGTPTEIQKLNNIVNDHNNEMIIGGTYKVQISDVIAIRGELDTSEINVNLVATRESWLTKSSELYLLVEKKEDEYKVIYWGRPHKIACFPKNELIDKLETQEFELEYTSQNRLCTHLE